MSHKNITKVVILMVSGFSVQVSVSWLKGSEVNEQKSDDRWKPESRAALCGCRKPRTFEPWTREL